ncbi:hypothetical protein [Polyangium sp. y55x31]|uniref:hypothetical protein n=1 Tax=Polyangium sp. y55x31 TaxID=3042688 RepID=UPI0024822B87|nr:hypothetical protein [Polyangium sp. y55x31]MDI1480152.1 hypothetical protein [Polyangium sp. y55x31]
MTRFASLRSLGTVVAVLGLSSLGLLGGACSSSTPDESDAEHLGSADSALTDAQCDYFDVNGKIQICHHTGSAKHPYTIIRTSVQACADAFAAHAGDYVTSTDPTSPLYDPTCQGGGCLPAGAPSDATLPCCDGLVSQNGTCTDPCDADPCQNGGSCAANSTGYTCACPAGFTGTNCQINIDECENNPCLHGSCTDGVNSYTCACDPGWTGKDCDTPTCVPTTCAAQGATCGTLSDGCGGTLDCGSCGAGSTCEDGTCQPSGPVCPCDALPGWLDFNVSGTQCINYSGQISSVYLYLKDTGSSRGIFVQSAIEESPGTPGGPAMCGVVGPNNVGNAFINLDTQDQLEACVQSLSVVSTAGGVPCP